MKYSVKHVPECIPSLFHYWVYCRCFPWKSTFGILNQSVNEFSFLPFENVCHRQRAVLLCCLYLNNIFNHLNIPYPSESKVIDEFTSVSSVQLLQRIPRGSDQPLLVVERGGIRLRRRGRDYARGRPRQKQQETCCTFAWCSRFDWPGHGWRISGCRLLRRYSIAQLRTRGLDTGSGSPIRVQQVLGCEQAVPLPGEERRALQEKEGDWRQRAVCFRVGQWGEQLVGIRPEVQVVPEAPDPALGLLLPFWRQGDPLRRIPLDRLREGD